MRELVLTITCDGCQQELVEDVDSVVLTVGKTRYEADLCSTCLDDLPFTRKLPKQVETQAAEFLCDCGRAFATARGLTKHQQLKHTS